MSFNPESHEAMNQLDALTLMRESMDRLANAYALFTQQAPEFIAEGEYDAVSERRIGSLSTQQVLDIIEYKKQADEALGDVRQIPIDQWGLHLARLQGHIAHTIMGKNPDMRDMFDNLEYLSMLRDGFLIVVAHALVFVDYLDREMALYADQMDFNPSDLDQDGHELD